MEGGKNGKELLEGVKRQCSKQPVSFHILALPATTAEVMAMQILDSSATPESK